MNQHSKRHVCSCLLLVACCHAHQVPCPLLLCVMQAKEQEASMSKAELATEQAERRADTQALQVGCVLVCIPRHPSQLPHSPLTNTGAHAHTHTQRRA